MLLRVLILCCLPIFTHQYDVQPCLTGYMTDVQDWVHANGSLTDSVDSESSIDLSATRRVVTVLQKELSQKSYGIKYLSLARCNLKVIPKIFSFKTAHNNYLWETIEYLTLYGNNFTNMRKEEDTDSRRRTQITGQSIWHTGFYNVTLLKLRELDLRACSIEIIDDYVFKGMSNLEALYLGENRITYVSSKAFIDSNKLIHLDISRNNAFIDRMRRTTLLLDGSDTYLNSLQSLDLSYTELSQNNVLMFNNIGRSLQRLSICWSNFSRLEANHFNETSLKYLDISGNFRILLNSDSLKGLERTLKVLYATSISLNNFDIFENMNELEILKINNNNINVIHKNVAKSLTKLQILDLNRNRLMPWFSKTFDYFSSLKLLTLRNNNINVISEDMVNDIKNISYLALSGNFIVCSCHSRDLLDFAAANERKWTHNLIEPPETDVLKHKALEFHIALQEFNNIIDQRNKVSDVCKDNSCDNSEYLNESGNFVLLDYDPNDYTCLQASISISVPFTKVRGCNPIPRMHKIGELLDERTKKQLILLLILPGVLLPMMLGFFTFRRKLRYFYISMRNSAALSLISKDEAMDEDKIYNYDVFVSYCNEDRCWMLDQLLPHLEAECSVSVCMHERDFQVGLSILENIVSCMDRSRMIILVLSKKFLKSQWCQFEMHLAQHRLLETRREDLILILLEDIPRRLRPTTLHYLMLTKTFIVWPQNETERPVFWKRLKKSLIVHKSKYSERSSIA